MKLTNLNIRFNGYQLVVDLDVCATLCDNVDYYLLRVEFFLQTLNEILYRGYLKK